MRKIAFSLPTGIGAKIGGYAGDIGYIVREFSKYFQVVVNPNAVNGGILSAINSNMLYVEGYAFDEFLSGAINLKPVDRQNKIGVVLDSAIPKDVLNAHFNTINAAKKVWGLDISEPVLSGEPLGVEFFVNYNISSGTISNPEALLKSCRECVDNEARALAIVGYFGEDADDENYSNGTGIDPIGGVEAVISHLVVKKFHLPAAHAPAFSDIDISRRLENPKVAAECISSTYLPCILQGLQFAPQFEKKGGIKNTDIEYLIVPDGALGSKGVLEAIRYGIKVCAVNNPSKLDVGCDKLKCSDILRFDTYFDCLDYIKK